MANPIQLVVKEETLTETELSQPVRSHLSTMIKNSLGAVAQFLGMRSLAAVRILSRMPADPLSEALNQGRPHEECEALFGSLQREIALIITENGRTIEETATTSPVPTGAFNLHRLLTSDFNTLASCAAADLSVMPQRIPETAEQKARRAAADRLTSFGVKETLDDSVDEEPDSGTTTVSLAVRAKVALND